MQEFKEVIAGVDEAGRGPLAGPVVAAAVVLDPAKPIPGLADSKKLSAKKRESLAISIREHALSWAVCRVEADEIDRINILQATLQAMSRSVDLLDTRIDKALIDGNRCPELNVPAEAIIKGDTKVAAISAASILAKVARDEIMLSMHENYPEYGFEKHKGYPTAAHVSALMEHGPCPQHRRSYAPVQRAAKKPL